MGFRQEKGYFRNFNLLILWHNKSLLDWKWIFAIEYIVYMYTDMYGWGEGGKQNNTEFVWFSCLTCWKIYGGASYSCIVKWNYFAVYIIFEYFHNGGLNDCFVGNGMNFHFFLQSILTRLLGFLKCFMVDLGC